MAPMSHRSDRQSKPAAVQCLLAVLVLLLLCGVYLALMRLSIDISRLEGSTTPSERDFHYLLLHTGMIVLGAAVGFVLGKWLNGLGFAYAVLFVVVLAFAMLGLQMGTYAAACEGHNDVIRHWTC
jgi:hypothetical protein